jgi:putative transposase
MSVDLAARDAIVQVLARSRDAGGLTTEQVQFQADVLGISRRHLYRLLNRGSAEHRRRAAFALTEDERVLYAESCGHVSRMFARLEQEGQARGSIRTYRRAVQEEFNLSERDFLRKGEAARRDGLVKLKRTPGARNGVWETDHMQFPIEVIPPRGKKLVRPWLTATIDLATRAITGFAISLRPTAADVLVTLRHGVMPDERYGPFRGVPEMVVPDNGREFSADAVSQVARKLGFVVAPTRAYSPSEKGTIERFNRTIQDELVAILPGYTDAPKNARGRVYGTSERLTYEEFCEHVYKWITAYNLERPHSALQGRTPEQAWQDDPAPLREISDEQARTLTLPHHNSKVGCKGVRAHKGYYVYDRINDLVGETVQVHFMPHDRRSVDIYHRGNFIATAHPSDQLTDEQAKAFLSARKGSKRRVQGLRGQASRKQTARFASMNGASKAEMVSLPEPDEPPAATLVPMPDPQPAQVEQINQPWTPDADQEAA